MMHAENNRISNPQRIITYILLIGGGIFTVLPLLWLARSSVMSVREIFTMPPLILPEVFQWDNYVQIFKIQPLGKYFINTIGIVFLNIIGAILSNTVLAYAFARIKFKGRNMMYSICLATLMLPAAVTMIPLFVEWKFLGGLNSFAPLIVPAFFGNAFYMFMLRQFFATIPLEYDEAAFVDGANDWQIITRIIMPLSKPALAVVAIFTFLATWNDFIGPLLYLNDLDKFTVALGLKALISSYNTQWNYLMAAAMVVVLPLILLFAFTQRYFIEGLTLGGVKG